MPHSQSPRGLLPLFPSFSLICLGQSGLYQHRDGLGDAIHSFRSGSEYLLPYDFKMEIDPTKWLTDMQKIYTVVPEQTYNHLVKQKQRLEDDLIPVALERVKV
jgi:hypothetical protein